MISKTALRQKAIALRKEGKTYSEILRVVPVAKSSLSLWFKGVGLSMQQTQRITAKKRAAQLRGGARKKEIRLQVSKEIFEGSKEELGAFSRRDLFILGVALYWAEGAKAKEYRPSVAVKFANSDPEMVKLFLLWLRRIFHVKDANITLTVYLHQNHKQRIHEVENFWLKVTGLERSSLANPVFKSHNPKTQRKNSGDSYMGLVSVYVRNSTNLNRRIQGLVYGIIRSQKDCPIV